MSITTECIIGTVRGSFIGTIGNFYHFDTIGNFTNGTNCTIGKANGTIGITIGTNGITNGTIGKTLNDIVIPFVPLGNPERMHTHSLTDTSSFHCIA